MFKSRQYLVFFFLVTFFLSLFVRLFYLQVFSFDKFSKMAIEQHNKVLKISPLRGIIFDCNMEPLAVNLDVPSVYCNPRSIKNKEYTADALSEVFQVDRRLLLEKFNREKAFVWIKRKIDSKTAERVKELKPAGINFVMENKRKYSNDNMAAHLIGFVGIDNEGLEGLELEFNEKLKGKPGWRHLIKDANSNTVLFNDRESLPPQNGYNLVLTIDSIIQYITEEELRKAVQEFKATNASVVVMEPFSGRILAQANYPDYNLNAFTEVSPEFIKNNVVTSVYEPGSVFKIIAASAALNEKFVNLDDKFYCENGYYKTSGRVLHDSHKYGMLTFREIIGKSSNIGTVKVAQKLGGAKLYSYIERFGFGQKTGIGLPGEVDGISRPFSEWSRSDITTIPIGQGIAVTPIQLACAVSVIANGGYLIKPYVVDKITTWENGVYKEFKPVIKRRVLREETCMKMKDIMRYVVTTGTGRRAASSLYQMCGKTGTAQMVNPEGGYYSNKYDATFVGFAPMNNPAVSIVVAVHNPHPRYFGGIVAAPVFKKIAERVLQYMDSNKSKMTSSPTGSNR